MAVKILIDSASDINKEEAERMGVTMIPMSITFGDEEFLDGVDLLPEQFYERLIENTELPKTSQVTPVAFKAELERLTANGDEVIVITISSKLSGTYNSACIAARSFGDRVYVVDSLNACIGERLLCEYALRLVKQGMNVKNIVDELNGAKTRIKLLALLGTLEYLKKGGRISTAVAFAGGLFCIKPVVAVVDGAVELVGKAMGSKKGNNLLTELVSCAGGIDFDMPLGTIYSGNNEAFLQKYIEDSGHLWKDSAKEIPRYILGATIGTHIGPGAIGVAFFAKKQ